MVGMIVGYNHRLGRGSEGNYESLKPLAMECGFELECVGQHLVEESKVSSTVVREAMSRGDMREVERLTESKYLIIGSAKAGVVNISDCYKLLPVSGLYEAVVTYNNISSIAQIEIQDRRVVLSEPINGKVIFEL
jgi:riboflavin kinase/FMN adenylyltransferase